MELKNQIQIKKWFHLLIKTSLNNSLVQLTRVIQKLIAKNKMRLEKKIVFYYNIKYIRHMSNTKISHNNLFGNYCNLA